MLRRPLFWLTVSLLCFVGALYFFRQGEARRLADLAAQKPSAPAPAEVKPASATNAQPVSAVAPAAPDKSMAAAKAASKSRYPYRLSNTSKTVNQLLRSDKAIHLMNALIDTGKPVNLAIPDRLRAPKDNGSYIVQAHGLIDNDFRALLQNAGATIVSSVPNNAFLVRVSDAGAQQIAASAQSVLPYEPYYKLEPSLLKAVMENGELSTSALKVTLFPDVSPSILNPLNLHPMSTEPSPFGQVVTVPASADALINLAQLPGVQAVAPAYQRKTANDLSRTTLGISADSLITTSNYLTLNGSGVLVNINDTGVDATHPDLTGRIFGGSANSLTDTNGHGTHVAGTILGDGTKSSTVTNAIGSVPGASFRGMASGAKAYVITLDSATDSQLQEQAGRTNTLISNNSWNYDADPNYDIAAASFDAAVRDAVPEVSGPQPLIFVFSAGNNGQGTDDGQNGTSDSILSPGTAKNAITVGAVEQLRNITNQVVENGVTNQPFLPSTDTSDEVASFSGRGNVGIEVEGDNGRFKPDVVAPGTFVVSTRSQQWDTNAYYNPTNIQDFPFPNQSVDPGNVATFGFPVPNNLAEMIITVSSNNLSPSPFPLMPIYVGVNAVPSTNNPLGFNQVILPGILSMNPGDTLFISVGDGTNVTANFDMDVEVLETNGDPVVLGLLRQLNDSLAPPPEYYRYESGTSMAAAGVSGVLACMEQFFNQTLHISNASPALMKALLINGARSLSSPGQPYDFQVSNPLNIQGWGLPNLPNSIPPALVNYPNGSNAVPVLFFDQDPANALATGQSKIRTLKLSSDAAQQPLRVTLVWTDPPGNPTVGIKLVNDLDLIVSNVDTGDVYYGNDIPAGSIYNEVAPTNAPAPVDAVNNVENVYLSGLTGTNFTITVYAHHVNVNATTLNSTNVVQDYALVISTGDAGGTASTPFSLTDTAPIVSPNNISPVTTAFNGVPLLNQRIGANSQYAATTNGITNQWNFYVYTNTPSLTNSAFTNVAFITFFPPNIGVPRMEASAEIDTTTVNATRFAGADIDLYVSINPGLTNLDPVVISNAFNNVNGAVSVGRTGDETVVFTNSAQGQVYYIGVKCEDQQGAQYGFAGVASSVPFDQTDTNGNSIITMAPLPAQIPGGTPTAPQSVFLFGVGIKNNLIRKVSVTNAVTHQDFADLIGTLSHSETSVVLNNHSTFSNRNDTTETLIYDDSGENDIPGSRTSDGPGSLRDYVGGKSVGGWIFTMVNDSSQSDTGQINNFQMTVEPQTTNAVTHTLPGSQWFYDFVDVPVNCTNLTVFLSMTAANAAPLELFVKRGGFPTLTDFDKMAVINPPGSFISISTFDSPPLNPGRYFIGVYNPNSAAVTFTLSEALGISTTPATPFQFLSIGNEPIADDAVTYSTNTVGLSSALVSAEVGVRINHPRVSDLVLTLISPEGTRVLLAENRGGSTTKYGSGFNTTNSLPSTTNGTAASEMNSIPLTNSSGTLLISYNFYTVPDDMRIYYGGALIFDSGLINLTGTFAVDFGPGTATNLVIWMNQPGTNPSTNTSDAWTYTATLITKGTVYATFTEDTTKTTLPIKFAVPPFGTGPAFTQPQTLFTTGFDDVTPGSYSNSAAVDGWSVPGTNPVTVVSVPVLARGGSNVLALHNAGIFTNVTTTPGTTYTLTFSAHGRPLLAPVSWWKAERTAHDTERVNSGLLENNAGFTNGLVGLNDLPGQAFQFDGVAAHVRVPDSPSLEFSNSMTAEAWIFPTNTPPGWGGNAAVMVKFDDVQGTGGSAFSMSLNSVPQAYFGISADGFDDFGSEADGTTTIPNNQWTHIAGTYDGTNVNIYVNGILEGSTPFTMPIFVSTNDDLGIGAILGGDALGGGAAFFPGLIDEATVYSNALTPLQLQGIYAAGSAGKVGPNPDSSTVSATVTAGTVSSNFSAVDSWTDYSITFLATDANTAIQFTPGADGMLLDSISLAATSVANSSNDFLPEESLSKLVGQNPSGDWLLEVLDNRAGPAVTNPVPLLVSWQLTLVTETTTPTATPLSDAIPVTNTVPPNTTAYFIVNVPPWAQFATNTLVNVSGGPALNLWFNQNFEPLTTTNGGDVNLTPGGVTASGVAVLTTNGVPPLEPGQTYYLGVQNLNPVPVTFSIEVDFDITTLTNLVPLTNTLAQGGIPRYYQFDVDTNAIGVTFQLLGLNGIMELVASKGPPLPTLSSYAYNAGAPVGGTETILVLSNSTPVPLSPGRWYLGVFNLDTTAPSQTYTILASELTQPNIIWLTNGVPFTMTNYPPGPALSTFFGFIITNNPVSALFEVYNMNGNVDLTVNRGTNNFPYGPPSPPGSPLTNSANPGTNYEEIVVRTNGALGGLVTTNLNDVWYLGVPNNATTNVTFTIYAVVSTNGLLTNGFPTTIGIQNGTNGLTFTWPTIAGQTYEIQSATNFLPTNTVWTPVIIISNAPPDIDSFLDTNSIAGTAMMFYRLLQLPTQ